MTILRYWNQQHLENHMNSGLFLNKIYQRKLDTVWTVSKIDSKFHPYKQLLIKKGLMKLFSSNGKKIFYRQSLKKTYIRRSLYIFSVPNV